MRFTESLMAVVLAGGAVAAPSLHIMPRADEKIEPVNIDPKRFDGMPSVTLEPYKTPALAKRREDKFELKDDITLWWKKDGFSAMLSGKYDGAHEKVINMDIFGDELEAVDCTPPEVFLDFKAREAFEAAQQKWGWVDEKKEHHFVLVMNHPKCGPENQRKAYNVTSKIRIENKQVSNLQRRIAALESRQRVGTGVSLNLDKSMNLFHDATTSLDCHVTSTGHLGAAIEVDWRWWGKPYTAFLEFFVDDVGLQMDVTLSGEAGFKHGDHLELLRTLFGVEIPHIAQFGVGPAIGVGYDVSLTAAGKVKWGALARNSGQAYNKICLWGCDHKSNGWDIKTEMISPTVKGSVDATADVYGYLAIHAIASVLGWGYEVGVAVQAPELKGDLDVKIGANACDNPNYQIGLHEKLDVSLDVYGYAGTSPINPQHKWDIWNPHATISDKCWGWTSPEVASLGLS
ncbi:hypothetical protein VFPPC_12121 [Pochonia chlamydosporia 170]|uniref:Uncharacterized protein n=1 Tax=Pochonia chlamydosporia 170 TaxID=1380566 RepID=A0A179EX12_METCM|nr:hypothetical protein VFPPC_12121 [Pochonia chlamydosporia 170]OAQ57724.2 hypothetical protein VFPPC_12121 [Pochonia chlamydosporia 170]